MSYYSTKPQPSASATAITVTNTNSSNSSEGIMNGVASTADLAQLNATISASTDIALVTWMGFFQQTTTTVVTVASHLMADGVDVSGHGSGRERAADATNRHNLGGSAIVTGLSPGTVNFTVRGTCASGNSTGFIRNFDVVVFSRSS